MKSKEFGVILKGLIANAGHASESDFAKASGIPQQTIQSLTSGVRRPTWDTVQLLAKSLGVSTDVFRDK